MTIFTGSALDDLDEIARCVLRGKKAEDRAGAGLQAVDMPPEDDAGIGVDVHLDRLAHGHLSHLCLLEIGDDPGILLHDGEEGLSRLHVLSRIDALLCDPSRDRGDEQSSSGD